MSAKREREKRKKKDFCEEREEGKGRKNLKNVRKIHSSGVSDCFEENQRRRKGIISALGELIDFYFFCSELESVRLSLRVSGLEEK